MPDYTITNTAGNTVATIGVATTTGATFPIELVGQGISSYGSIIGTTQYHMLENFSSDTAPVAPVTGMVWHAPTADAMSYYNGVEFVPLSSATTNSAALFDMLPSATAVDLSTTGVTQLYTDPNDGSSYHATGVMIKVNGTPAATTPALVNLLIATSEDVLENVSINLTDATKHAYFVIQGTTQIATGGTTINLEVTSPTDGALDVDVYLFGFKT